VTEHHLRVRRTARYYTLGPQDGPVTESWIVCHGYAQLARHFIRSFQPLDDGRRLIVAPEALNRYYHESAPGVHAADARVGATWMTREDRSHEIEDYVAYLDALVGHVSEGRGGGVRRVALGFSQGAATVSRWAALGAAPIDHVVLWGAGIAHDLPLHAAVFRGAALTLVAGSRDRYLDDRRVDRERERLHAAGVAHAVLRYDGGHEIVPDALSML
jgi:predicted esterase